MTQNTMWGSKRLISNLLNTWKGLSSPLSGKRLELSPYLHEDEITRLREKIQACLDAKGGQVSARARAAELGKAYLVLNDEGKSKYLQLLVNEFGVDHDQVREIAEALFSDLDDTARSGTEGRLRAALTPPYLTLLTQFNALPQGLKFLVDMRSDLRRLEKEHPCLVSIDKELRGQLSSWFDIGFLDLQRIDWNAPASLLEKLIAYEAVHKVESWIDLHHRLAENRRCFAFFHPRMPEEPLIFVWVALVDELSDNVDTLLDTSQNEEIRDEDHTAIFYSITSTQRGLSGVSLGDFLIKRVTDELRREMPQLTEFSTLSPIPGFSTWLKGQMESDIDSVISAADREKLKQLSDQSTEQLLAETCWLNEEVTAEAMKEILIPLAARYITGVKNSRSKAMDSVAHFHLSNGAIVERINWLADTSGRGKSQSYTMMINYLYDLDQIENNHEQYIQHGSIAMSKTVEGLLQQSGK